MAHPDNYRRPTSPPPLPTSPQALPPWSLWPLSFVQAPTSQNCKHGGKILNRQRLMGTCRIKTTSYWSKLISSAARRCPKPLMIQYLHTVAAAAGSNSISEKHSILCRAWANYWIDTLPDCSTVTAGIIGFLYGEFLYRKDNILRQTTLFYNTVHVYFMALVGNWVSKAGGGYLYWIITITSQLF